VKVLDRSLQSYESAVLKRIRDSADGDGLEDEPYSQSRTGGCRAGDGERKDDQDGERRGEATARDVVGHGKILAL
jgi:hypothetical protein